MRQDSRSPVTYITMGIAAFFLAGFFLLVVFGAQTYRGIVEGQTQNNHTRALSGYLATCARAYDSEGSVTVFYDESREGLPVLVMEDRDSGYALRLYKYEGSLVEDYAQAGSELNPDLAMVIGETETFLVREVSEGIFEVTTDAGVVYFHSRSGKAQER